MSTPPFAASFVEELMSKEKEDARRWLRAEMDSLLDSLFGRLTTKFTNCLVPNATSNGNPIDPMGGLHRDAQPENTNHYYSAHISNSIQSISNIPDLNYAASLDRTFRFDNNTTENARQMPHSNSVQIKEETEEESANNFEDSTPADGPPLQANELEDLSYDEEYEEQHSSDEDCNCADCNLLTEGKMEYEDDNLRDAFASNESNPEQGPPKMSPQSLPSTSKKASSNCTKSSSTVLMQTLSVECDICKASFPQLSKLRYHKLMAHRIQPNECILNGCNRVFASSELLAQHFSTDHPANTKFSCDKCDQSFTWYYLWYRHRVRFHQAGQFKCTHPGCDFGARYQDHVYRHYQQEHRKVYRCTYEQCGRTFNWPSSLSTHIKGHSNSVTYRCKWQNCKYTSNFQHNMSRHVKFVHFRLTGSSAQNKEATRNARDYIEKLRINKYS